MDQEHQTDQLQDMEKIIGEANILSKSTKLLS